MEEQTVRESYFPKSYVPRIYRLTLKPVLAEFYSTSEFLRISAFKKA